MSLAGSLMKLEGTMARRRWRTGDWGPYLVQFHAAAVDSMRSDFFVCQVSFATPATFESTLWRSRPRGLWRAEAFLSRFDYPEGVKNGNTLPSLAHDHWVQGFAWRRPLIRIHPL
jgi:hypothetical protein